jgi:hypothetical protein
VPPHPRHHTGRRSLRAALNMMNWTHSWMVGTRGVNLAVRRKLQKTWQAARRAACLTRTLQVAQQSTSCWGWSGARGDRLRSEVKQVAGDSRAVVVEGCGVGVVGIPSNVVEFMINVEGQRQCTVLLLCVFVQINDHLRLPAHLPDVSHFPLTNL